MRYLHTEDVELLDPTQVGCYCKQKSLMPTAMSLWNILGPDAMLAELIGTICNNSLFNIYQKNAALRASEASYQTGCNENYLT